MISNILYRYCITAQNVSYLHENISIHSFYINLPCYMARTMHATCSMLHSSCHLVTSFFPFPNGVPKYRISGKFIREHCVVEASKFTVSERSTYCRFSYAGTWELVNLLVGTKNFSYHICY